MRTIPEPDGAQTNPTAGHAATIPPTPSRTIGEWQSNQAFRFRSRRTHRRRSCTAHAPNSVRGICSQPRRDSNFRDEPLRHIYFTRTLDAAAWGAELAVGDGRPRAYVIEPTGDYEDDPNVTDKRFPGNPTLSYRSLAPLRVLHELTDWVGHSPEQIQAMRDGLDQLRREGTSTIID